MIKIPILKINQFEKSATLNDFYINSFSNHIKLNQSLINKPHKHNFYLCVMFTKGSGIHEIDFNSYIINPGKVFFLRPGQTHFWRFDSDPEGFIFFHSQEFYELKFLKHKLNSFPFYHSFQNPPILDLAKEKTDEQACKFLEIYTENQQNHLFRELKIVSLINSVYIDFTREYTATLQLQKTISSSYLKIFEQLETLIDKHFQSEKLPKFYANQLNITTKHLNRIVRKTVNKTTSDLISERIILEAKRLIVHTNDNLTTIANNLEFFDYSYFSRIFKSRTGINPMNFRKKYINK